jgi:lipopolysaccharide/colanic/teichoic acid biosynthesis glycosyltransferase
MLEKSGMTLPEFSAMMESPARLKGLAYLESPVKQLWEKCMTAVVYPWLLPLVGLQAIQVLALDGKPVIYDLARNNMPEEVKLAVWGERGKQLKFPKVRSMYNGAEDQEEKSLEEMTLRELGGEGDERVIPGRRWWRRRRWDELPQLGAVITGNLSLVGPRLPTRAQWKNELENSPSEAFREFRRLMLLGRVMPGIVGAYFLLRDKDRGEARYLGEAEYIQKAAMGPDWRIVWATVKRLAAMAVS